MPLPAFWNLVAQLGWKRGAPIKPVKRFIMDRLSAEEAADADLTFRELRSTLYAVVEAYEVKTDRSCGLSDDSFADLLSHIIGLGQAEYEAVLVSPSLAVKRARAGDFSESFSYVWPDAEDYEKRGNVAAFKGWAEKNRENYAAMVANPFYAPVKAEGEKVVAAMDAVLAGNAAAFLAQRAEVEAAVTAIGAFVEKIQSELRSFDSNPWAVKNLFSNVAEATS